MRRVAAAAADETGYVITDHFLQLTGLCEHCARNDRSRRDA
jgi:Fe2+ or Zn2+ uptake regulation protein